MINKIFELRVLKAIISISNDPSDTAAVHFINDGALARLSPAEREKFTKIFFDYPGFSERYKEPRMENQHHPKEFEVYPENTLGYQYSKFMRDNNLLIDWYPPMKEAIPLHFARNYQYQTHDILHTIAGFNSVKPLYELGLQGFYIGQGASNPTAMISFAAAALDKLRKSDAKENMEFMDYVTEGYLMGKKAKKIIFKGWENDWHTDIDQLREELGILPFKGVTPRL
jgi:ubiquinone biosynthesis protein Coq4